MAIIFTLQINMITVQTRSVSGKETVSYKPIT